MKRFVRILAVLLFIAVFRADAGVKYVFLFIGDGMGPAQRGIAQEYSRLNRDGKGLFLNAFPHQAMTRTSSANSYITDSAASGTAIACGVKTNNYTIGLAPDGTRLESVAATAKKNGKKVGILTTDGANMATPSAFFGHRKNRNMYAELAEDLADSGFDFLSGNGLTAATDAARRELLEKISGKGYRLVMTDGELRGLKRGEEKILCLAPVPWQIENDGKSPTFAEVVEKAVERLENPNGFFLMAEGARVDHASHGNDAAAALHEVLALDKAVEVALRFAEKHPGEVLIVVTADHETGGLTLTGNPQLLKYRSCTAGSLAAELGKAADFAEAGKILGTELGFRFEGDSAPGIAVSGKEKAELEKKFADGKKDELAKSAVALFEEKAGFKWTTHGHTAVPVITTAFGAGSEQFCGMLENTDIARILREAVSKE